MPRDNFFSALEPKEEGDSAKKATSSITKTSKGKTSHKAKKARYLENAKLKKSLQLTYETLYERISKKLSQPGIHSAMNYMPFCLATQAVQDDLEGELIADEPDLSVQAWQRRVDGIQRLIELMKSAAPKTKGGAINSDGFIKAVKEEFNISPEQITLNFSVTPSA